LSREAIRPKIGELRPRSIASRRLAGKTLTVD
jgi:hypothetical protein